MTAGWPGRVVRMLTPWATKAERHAAIEQARGEAEKSRQGAARAKDIEQQIKWLYQENHYVQIIADQIRRGYRNGT